GLDSAFRQFANLCPGLSFRVDNLVMRREWEPVNLPDGQTNWTTVTRLIYCFTERPMWEFMDHIAKVLDAEWHVENDVCVLSLSAKDETGAPTRPDAAKPPALASSILKPQAKLLAAICGVAIRAVNK